MDFKTKQADLDLRLARSNARHHRESSQRSQGFKLEAVCGTRDRTIVNGAKIALCPSVRR